MEPRAIPPGSLRNRIYLRTAPDAAGIIAADREVKKRLVRVLRMSQGDFVEVITPGKRWRCTIQRVLPSGIELHAEEELPAPAQPGTRLVLGQAIPKGERFDWLLQKAAELGVAEIYPLITRRTIARPTRMDLKLQRWNDICEQAAGQSENAFPPLVHPAGTLEAFLALPHSGLRLFLHERSGARPLPAVLAEYPGNSIIFVVGPEGGWADEERESAVQAGFRVVHLGTRILRSETAGLVLAAILQYHFGAFSDEGPAQQ